MKIKNLRLFTLLLFAMITGSSISVTAQVVELLKDIAGLSSSQENFMAECNGKLYISANDKDADGNYVHGLELWVSDGTDVGTQLLKDIFPGPEPSEAGWANNFTVCNNNLFFIANDGIHGHELWVTDGTESGTNMVKDIYVGGANYNGLGLYSHSDQLYTFNGKVYFCANDGDPLNGGHAGELWCSDGTETGTYMVKDIRVSMDYGTSSSNPMNFCEFNGNLYFQAYDGAQNDGGHSGELWVTDGTEAGTYMVKDIAPVQISEVPSQLTVCNGKLFFTTDDGTHGKELWVTDGTEAGTILLKDILDGASGSFPKYLTAIDGFLYFNAIGGSNSNTLWKTDGTEQGTVMVSSNCYDPTNIKAYKGNAVFLAKEGPGNTSFNWELWTSNGTDNGTLMIKEINPSLTQGIDFMPDLNFKEGFVEYRNKLYFRASDDGYGTRLWETDGTEAGTIQTPGQYINAIPDPLSAIVIEAFTFKVSHGSLYYPAKYDEVIRTEPYKLTTLPITYAVSGSGSYCAITVGLPVGLSVSDEGVTYTLYKDGVAQTPAIEGTGEPISFGNQLAGTYTITGTNVAGTVDMIGAAVITETPLLPISVTIEANGNNFCGPTEVTLTATTVNAGDSPEFNWYINASPAGSNQPTFTYTPLNNDEVYVVITSDFPCTTGSPSASNYIIFYVADQLTPAVTITASENPVNEGSPVTFTPAPVNGGTPTYQWFVNGAYAGDITPYTYTPEDGDEIYAEMASSLECITAEIVVSNTILMDVLTGIDIKDIFGLKVYSFDKVIYLESTTGLTGEACVYDVAGRKLITRTLINETKTLIPVSFLTNGAYIVRITTGNSQLNTKVFIR